MTHEGEHATRPTKHVFAADRKYLAELVREHGIAGARRQTGIPISDHTLGKIAHEFGIVLPKGRRAKAAA